MRVALIGHTGFVGSNLARQVECHDFYNSKDIEQIEGRSYDRVLCCGAPAEKWRANRDPDNDRRCLARLMQSLARVRAGQVILVSTIDVIPEPAAVYENTPFDPQQATAYGRHRHELEVFVRDRFASLIVRLPGLFGAGLKKNIVYDFLNHNAVDRIHHRSVFQFYNLDDLGHDIQVALGAGLPLIHLATEPVSVEEVAAEAFGMRFTNTPDTPPARYDFRTLYAEFFGGAGDYVVDRQGVLQALKQFVGQSRRAKCA